MPDGGDLDNGVDTGHSLHDHVGNEDVGISLPCCRDRLFAATRDPGTVTASVQNDASCIGNDGFIIDDQHVRAQSICYFRLSPSLPRCGLSAANRMSQHQERIKLEMKRALYL